jgi:hypothetical protein
MWTVNDGTADLLVHNTSVFEYEPVEGNVYVVTGPLDYDFDEWKIQLRFETDVQSGADILAPQISSAEVVAPTIVKLQFSEEVEETSAETLANYSINNGVTVLEASQHGIIKSQVFLTVSPLQGGSYELTVQGVADLVGNVMESTVVPFTSTGINDLSANANLSVYPNPSNGTFSIKWNGEKQENVVVSLYTVTGMKAYSETSTLGGDGIISIDAGQLNGGFYLLEVKGAYNLSRCKIMIK